MVEAQIISKILQEQSLDFLVRNSLNSEYFPTYSDEYSYIQEFFKQYNKVPDKETFQAKFPEFSILQVNEPDSYLLDTVFEEHTYGQAVPIIQKCADLLQTDSKAAVDYITTAIKGITNRQGSVGVDIISRATERLKEHIDAQRNPTHNVIPTGFDQLDDIIGGWNKGEELVIIFSRTGNGKTMYLLKTLQTAWEKGYKVGLIEPEMSYNKIGFRFDSMYQHFSESDIRRGNKVDGYSEYIKKLSENATPFYVAGPKDFNRKVTVSKLRSFVLNNKIDILAIDGISYMYDERSYRDDKLTNRLTHISEDLMDMSVELKIPILIVAQSNREGVKEDDSPGLENIRDSDGIAFNCSLALSIRHKDQNMEIQIRKNRYGSTGDKLVYHWEVDNGQFEFVPTDDAVKTSEDTKPKPRKQKIEKLTDRF